MENDPILLLCSNYIVISNDKHYAVEMTVVFAEYVRFSTDDQIALRETVSKIAAERQYR